MVMFALIMANTRFPKPISLERDWLPRRPPDYWVNDQRGDPLFVVTAEANAALTRILPAVLGEVRKLLGPKRRATVVFDSGGWSPKLFRELLALDFDILPYRKGRTRRIAEARLTQHKAKLDGRCVRYLLHEQPVRFLKGKLRLRQITRLTQGGHQTPIVTSRWDLRAIVLAYRMFERWRQENFFKYVREEYLIDALADYEIEPDDANRSVPNPARKAIEKELRRMRAQLAKLRANYAAITLAARPRRLPRTAAQQAKEKLRTEIAQAKARLEKLQAQHHEDGTRVVDPRQDWYDLCVAAKLESYVSAKRQNGQTYNKYVGLNPHDFRRSALRNMTRRGVTEKVAMTISGHSTRSVFDRYNIVDETDLAEATRKIEARNQPSISADESHTKLTHDNVRVS